MDYRSPTAPLRMTRLPTRFETRVVGVTFVDTYPRCLYLLADAAAHAAAVIDREGVDDRRWLLGKPFRRLVDVHLLQGRLPVELRREPDNQADPAHAVAVHVPLLDTHSRIGYIPAKGHGSPALLLGPALDAGQRWSAWVSAVYIHADHQDRPGITIGLQHHKPSVR